MYEIWSLGHKPFEGYANMNVMERYCNKGYINTLTLPISPDAMLTMVSWDGSAISEWTATLDNIKATVH